MVLSKLNFYLVLYFLLHVGELLYLAESSCFNLQSFCCVWYQTAMRSVQSLKVVFFFFVPLAVTTGCFKAELIAHSSFLSIDITIVLLYF